MTAVAAASLELLGITKSFGPVEALRGADLTLARGEVHALLGENGAGKSTLMHVAYGLVRPDAGRVRVHGVERAMRSPVEARRLGIGMVHQHFTSIPALTVAENVALAAGWAVSPGALRERVRRAADGMGLPLDPDARAGRLSVGLKQRLEIVKALAADARVLILDEPAAVLAPAEADELLAMVRRFAAGGGAAVLITHKLDEALRAADRVTVLRRGRVVLSGPAGEQTPTSLARAMLGEAPGASGAGAPGCHPERSEGTEASRVRDPITGPKSSGPFAPPRVTTGEQGPVLVRCEALEVARESGYGVAVRGATLLVRGGEIVGIAAVEGNGQRELLRAVAGRVLPLRGRLEVEGPVGFVPEDRTTEGLVPELSLVENVVLGSGAEAPWVRHGRVSWRAARAATAALIAEHGIRAPGPDTPAAALSGGNQQKLVVARELARGPRVVVAENPTRGLDLGATAAVHDRLRAAAAAGAAVLFHSSDLDETLALAHHVVVMVGGVASAMPPGATRAETGEAMLPRAG